MRKVLKQLLGRVGLIKSHPAVSVPGNNSNVARDIRRKDIGRRGEEAAVQALMGKGFRILDRNYLCRSGEIDIIAEHKGQIVFIEVKTRSHRSWETPESAVTTEKQARILRAATYYLAGYRNPSPVRYDIASVLTDDNDAILSVEIKSNAFGPGRGEKELSVHEN